MMTVCGPPRKPVFLRNLTDFIKFSVFVVYILKETHSHAINGFSVFVKGILKLLEINRSLEAYN